MCNINAFVAKLYAIRKFIIVMNIEFKSTLYYVHKENIPYLEDIYVLSVIATVTN